MSDKGIPKWFETIRTRHKAYMEAVEELGRAAHKEGPLDEKTAHLIQLAAATALRSEGAVHSHVRRALKSGASPDEIRHAIILVTSTIGFPTVSAALSWAEDVITSQQG